MAATLRWPARWIRPTGRNSQPGMLAPLGVALLAACAGCGTDAQPTADASACADYVDTWASPNETVNISRDGQNYLIEVSNPDGSANATYAATCSNGKLTDLPSTLGDIALIKGGAAIAWAGKELTRATAGETQAGAPTASSAPATSASSNAPDETSQAEHVVLRFRPVIAGPEPSAGRTPTDDPNTDPALPDPAAPPVTQEEAAAEYATLTCSFDIAPVRVDRSEDHVAACSQDGQFKYLLGPAIIEGTDVADATASIEQATGEWVVLLDLTSEGRQTWAEYTAAHVGENVAFTLDGRVVSAPTIQGAINGQTTITGNFSEESAQQLAEQLDGS